jgi:hypothetical protein
MIGTITMNKYENTFIEIYNQSTAIIDLLTDQFPPELFCFA